MKSVWGVVILGIGVMVSAVVWAQSPAVRPQKNEKILQPLEDKTQANKMLEPRKQRACPACSMNMQLMLERQMVATSDGGVVVWLGQKLVKYDKDLNLVKESELALYAEKQYERFFESRQTCPMCKKMREGMNSAKSHCLSGDPSQNTTEMPGHSQP